MSTLTFGVAPSIHYDVLYLAGTDIVVALSEKATANDCQAAANFFLRILNQKLTQEAKQLLASQDKGPPEPEKEKTPTNTGSV